MAGKSRILAVDDETDVLLILRTALKDDYDVATASNGAEGLAKAIEWQPDGIILDMMMPEMDGMQVLTELRRDPRTMRIPVIFLTGVSDRKKIREALDKGTQYYITKPFKHMDLMAKVALALREANDPAANP